MKKQELKSLIREIIREEIQSVVSEQAKNWWLKPAEAEVDAHLKPSDVHEDVRETDDPYSEKPALGTPRGQRQKWTAQDADGKTVITPKTTKTTGTQTAPTQPAAKKSPTVFQQKIKYKDADGKEHEATVKSLLSYPKDHPGRKAASAVVSKIMKREGIWTKSEEKMCEGDGCLDEKSVPQPYDRKKARKMSKNQIDNRKRIGRDMMSNEKTVSKFRKKYGDDWKSHLWAAASSAAFRQAGSTKSDDKKKK